MLSSPLVGSDQDHGGRKPVKELEIDEMDGALGSTNKLDPQRQAAIQTEDGG
jgi:hypothetical protein